MPDPASRAQRLDRAISTLLTNAPEVEAAAVVSFDGLPMASALPATMDEDRVAAMSAALLSLGERAAEGLGRGALSQVYIEGVHGTVFLVSADDEAVLVAVAAAGAKVGMMLYEAKRAAAEVAAVLRAEEPEVAPIVPAPVAAPVAPVPVPVSEDVVAAVEAATASAPMPEHAPQYADASYAAVQPQGAWPAYQPNGASTDPAWP